MALEYFEDVRLRQKSGSRQYPLGQEKMVDLAKKWVPQPFQIDAKYEQKTRSGGLLAICTKPGVRGILVRRKLPAWAWMRYDSWFPPDQVVGSTSGKRGYFKAAFEV